MTEHAYGFQKLTPVNNVDLDIYDNAISFFTEIMEWQTMNEDIKKNQIMPSPSDREEEIIK